MGVRRRDGVIDRWIERKGQSERERGREGDTYIERRGYREGGPTTSSEQEYDWR